jgi:hypothetical protein
MDGKIKKTFKNSHYSWWRSKAFDIKKSFTLANGYIKLMKSRKKHLVDILRSSP